MLGTSGTNGNYFLRLRPEIIRRKEIVFVLEGNENNVVMIKKNELKVQIHNVESFYTLPEK